MATDLQKGILCLIKVFHNYSGKEGDPATLTKGELKQLLCNEFEDLTQTSDKGALDKLFASMDVDANGVVDFVEYTTTVASIAILCNESLNTKH